ncbi:MAG: hypothetical protein N3F65_01595 [Nitrososphaeria archaeon]|nr:hypothetical protein [Nitrososphaeria archaeon]
MFELRLQRREPLPTLQRLGLPIIAVCLALLTSSIYVFMAGGDIIGVYYYLLTWPFENLPEIFVTATPLILLAFAVSIAFRSRFWNLGAHGQFIVGGLVAAYLGVHLKHLPPAILIPLICAMGWLGGAAVCLISWWLKVYRNQDEVLTSLLIWSAILQICAGLLTGPMRSPYTTYPQSEEIGVNAKLPILIPGTRLHLGAIVPFLMLAILWALTNRTIIRDWIVAATAPRVASLEGLSLPKIYFWVAFISGGIAGLAGACELMGILYYMTPFVGPNYGLVALAIAMLGGLDPIGATVAGLFFSILINGANAMSWKTGVPSFLSDLIQAQTLILFLVVGVFGTYRVIVRWRKPVPKLKGETSPTPIKTNPPSHVTLRLPRKCLVLLIGFIAAIAASALSSQFIGGSQLERMISSVVGMTLVAATPIALASFGEMLTEKTGVINLGILGIMIAGAGWGFMAAYFSNNIWVGVVAAALIGALFGLLHAFLVVSLGNRQHIAGIAITFYAMSLTYFVHRVLIGSPLVEPTVPTTPILRLGPLADLPFIGPIFSQSPYVYFGVYLLPILLALILARTRWGLVIRAVGENPRAADASLIRVHATRYIAIMVGGALMAVGGAYYSLIDLRSFNLNVGGEWSWIAMALVVLGNWDPLWVWAACIFFGFLNALQAWLVTTVVQIPYQFFQSIPYLLTVALSAILGKRARPPRAILQAYMRE